MARDVPEPGEQERLLRQIDLVPRIICTPGAEERIQRDARSFLREAGLAEEDVEHLAAAGPKRLLIYRKLVRRSLQVAIRREIPRAAARMEGAFDAWVGRFLDEEAPRSHYLRDVAFELVAWAAPRWATDASVPAYVADLARHELTAIEVATVPDVEGPTGADVDLDRPVRFHPSARLRRYNHAIHLLPEDEAARDAPERVPTALLAYRDADHDVRYLALTPLAAAILERLLRGEALRDAVVGGTTDLGHPLDGAVLTSTAALLTDLGERGAMLGESPRDTVRAPATMDEPDLNAAMDRYACGDARAFTAIHQALYPRLLAYLTRMSGSSAIADDLVQETFLRMHRARATFSAGAAAIPWAYAIARNVHIDHARSAKLRVTERLPSDPGPELIDRGGADAESAAIAAQTAELVERVLARIPPAQRDAFVLLRYEGLSVQDAAGVLGTTTSAVKLRAFRAYEALRAELSEVKAAAGEDEKPRRGSRKEASHGA